MIGHSDEIKMRQAESLRRMSLKKNTTNLRGNNFAVYLNQTMNVNIEMMDPDK